MDLHYWLTDNYDDACDLIRAIGWRSSLRSDELDDFTSRVIVRVLAARAVRNPRAFLATVAHRQIVDDIRRRVARPATVPWAEGRVDDAQEWRAVRHDAYRELELLDQVTRLGRNDARAILGHALGMRDRELAENGQTLDAVTKRRQRARERMAA